MSRRRRGTARRRRLDPGWLLGRHRGPVAPGRAALLGFWGVVALGLAALAGVGVWARDGGDPARTLVLAAGVLEEVPALDGPLGVAWRVSLEEATPWAAWRELLEGDVPPPLCPASPTAAEEGPAREVAAAVRALEQARRAGDRAALERSLAALRPHADGTGGPDLLGALAAYDLARGLAVAGDPATAARVLEPVVAGPLGTDAVPLAGLSAAAGYLRAGRVEADRAAAAFHARYLAGYVARRRGELDVAVSHYRTALNALNYVVAARSGRGLDAEGHFQRFPVDPGRYGCRVGPEPLVSLDGYAALVAAYLAAEGFRDPGGLAGELRRGRFDLDGDDPLAPVIRYGQARGSEPEGPIPEHFLWAVSNLQRVYHHNRLAPDPRLETARGVLLLELTGRPDWLEALEPYGAGGACGLLQGLADDLVRGAPVLAGQAAAPPAPDSALAAVAVRTFGRLRQACGEEGGQGRGTGTAESALAGAARDGGPPGPPAGAGLPDPGPPAPAVDPAARSAWLRLGGRFLGGGLPGRWEQRRLHVLGALRSGRAGDALQVELTGLLEQAEAERRFFASGRTPPDLPVGTAPAVGAELAEAWRRALFRDVALGLLAGVRGEGTGPTLRLTGAQAGDFVTALEGAVAHAGLRPAELYPAAELLPWARAGGRADALAWRVRHAFRSHPVAGWAFLAGAAALFVAAALVVLVNGWRFGLVARRRLYLAEWSERASGTLVQPPAGSGAP